MTEPRLEVRDALGRRVLPLDRPRTSVGRRATSDVHVMGTDVSREHAEITLANGVVILRDLGSRFGTFVNGTQVTEQTLLHGDHVRLGRSGEAELILLLDDTQPGDLRADGGAGGGLRQIATLLDGLRALGTAKLLDDVLALVLDAAIDLARADRGFVMLAGESGALDLKLARARGRVPLATGRFDTSRRIPEEVFASGSARVVSDLRDLASAHEGTVALGIRHVACVPLRVVRFADAATPPAERVIGVLYLDSREKGALMSNATLGALDSLAAEAAMAIDNARLYREALENARVEEELRVASVMQQALLPPARRTGPFFDAAGAAVPSRSIGGDFFDYADLPGSRLGIAIGDVSGKGPPAALLGALLQGVLEGQTFAPAGPAETMQRLSNALQRRAPGGRFATAFFGILDADGRLRYSNAGHNPPLLLSGGATERLDVGGTILGLSTADAYAEGELYMQDGDLLLLFSDGVTEATDAAGEEFGETRTADLARAAAALTPDAVLRAVLDGVRRFTGDAPGQDDMTVVIVRYVRGTRTAGDSAGRREAAAEGRHTG